MLVSSTPSVKKRKRTSAPSGSNVLKKKKRKNAESNPGPVPELILCADQLKTDVKDEHPTYEPILELKIKSEVPEFAETENTDLASELNLSNNIKVKKKKKKKKVGKKVEQQSIKQEDSILSIMSTKSEEPLEPTVVIKNEPCSPEKPALKIEPAEFTSLFNSNIKQELEEIDDAVDEHVCKKLCYRLSEPCIYKYDSTLHCAVSPYFVNNIKNGIKAQLKGLHLKYLESEQGVLLRYTNIKLKERTARIVSISPELHFDISCTMTVFRPKLGAYLEGTVVKIGPGYVNCLVFGYFTAVVYDRFTNPVEVGSVIRFKLQFYQVTVHNDFILKGSPVT